MVHDMSCIERLKYRVGPLRRHPLQYSAIDGATLAASEEQCRAVRCAPIFPEISVETWVLIGKRIGRESEGPPFRSLTERRLDRPGEPLANLRSERLARWVNSRPIAA